MQEKICPQCGTRNLINQTTCSCGHKFRTNFGAPTVPISQTQAIQVPASTLPQTVRFNRPKIYAKLGLDDPTLLPRIGATLLIVFGIVFLLMDWINDPLSGQQVTLIDVEHYHNFQMETSLICLTAIFLGIWWHRLTWGYVGLRRAIYAHVLIVFFSVSGILFAPIIAAHIHRRNAVASFDFDDPEAIANLGKPFACEINSQCVNAGDGYKYEIAFRQYDDGMFPAHIWLLDPKGGLVAKKTYKPNATPR